MSYSPAQAAPGWVVVVPVKLLTLAKSRLSVPGVDRRRLALALAHDTVAAAAVAGLVRRVLVVTNDRRVRATLASLPQVTVVADEPDAGLNAALDHAVRTIRAVGPDLAVAALAADLPALRADELDDALALAAAHPRAFVPDAAGLGTVLLTATAGADLRPAWGERSRVAHLAGGAVELIDDGPGRLAGLRRDVDTADDLAEALQLGVGPTVRRVLRTAPAR